MPFLTGLQGLLISALVSALLSGLGVGVVVHKVDQAALERVKLDWKTAEARALQAAVTKQRQDDEIARSASAAEAKAQEVIRVQTVTLTQEIPRYVTRNVPCVTVGLVRVLNAAASGVGPTDVPAPAGQSDDACAGIEVDTLAQHIADNYATARANAEQLNALEATLKALQRP